MPLLYLVLLAFAGVIVLGVALYTLSRALEKREPYGSFARLRTRHKLRFFRLLATDRRVPRLARLLPVLLAGYLAMPFDIIPDFIPVLGYMDDVAIVLGTLALIVRLTPRSVIDDLLREVAQPDT